jgi:DNA-binding PadR family transcriptional regulator
MSEREELSAVELAALLAVLRLGDESYGVSVRSEIEERTGRSPSIAAVYAALERLEGRGHVEAWLSEPVAERGGRARRQYRLTVAGAEALKREKAVSDRLWAGVGVHPALRGR